MLIALPGFLGDPSDFSPWQKKGFLAYPIESCASFGQWAQSFNKWVKVNTKAPRVLMGYSMGGRLALHALLDAPDLWEMGICVSTHPGLKTLHEREVRLIQDAQWKERFLNDSWENVLADWEAQPIFSQDGYRFDRIAKKYNRALFAEQIDCYSLGRQEDLSPKIASLEIPILWITGDKDLKYCKLAEEMATKHPFSKHEVIPGGHRAIFEKPAQFEHLILAL